MAILPHPNRSTLFVWFWVWPNLIQTHPRTPLATSDGARGIIVVGGRGTFWTYLYCLTTHSGKWRTIFCFPTMIHPEYQHTSWKGVTSRRCSYGLQATWQCSIESNKPLKWSTCLNPLWGLHLPTYGFDSGSLWLYCIHFFCPYFKKSLDLPLGTIHEGTSFLINFFWGNLF